MLTGTFARGGPCPRQFHYVFQCLHRCNVPTVSVRRSSMEFLFHHSIRMEKPSSVSLVNVTKLQLLMRKVFFLYIFTSRVC